MDYTKCELSTDYGYPLLMVTEGDLSRSWYYPLKHDMTNPQLIKGQPYWVFDEKQEYRVALFLPEGDKVLPKLLNVESLKSLYPST